MTSGARPRSAVARWTGRVVATSALVVLAGGFSSACAQGATLRGRILGLDQTVETARLHGAIRCAPRELALAKSHLRFASIELDQGQLSNAEAHLALAEPNARAALDMSPADRCTSRDFREIVTSEKPKPRPGDRDGDGLTDDIDRCPDQPENYNGFEDEDGCPDDPDTDSDGIPDSRDQCLLEPEDKDGYLDEDGCPDPDNDADGIPDVLDKSKDGRDCRNEPEDFDGFQDEDGCPDPDNDGDGILDVDDHCPNTPGVPGGDHPGCPKKHLSIVVTAREIRITQQIQFRSASWVILPVSFKILDEVVEAMKEFPKITIEVQGHTDNQGGGPYNLWLSNKRAESVMVYLTQHGIDAKRLTSKGYGLTQPLMPNDTEPHRQINRRVQFIRTESGPPKPPGAP